MGAIDLIGCVTNVTEYSSAKTMNVRISVIMTTTKPQILTSIWSADRCGLRSWSGLLNLFLQDGGYKVLWASLRELAARLLTLLFVEVVRVLAEIAVLVLTRSQSQTQR
jgi:hypothetical protein